MYALVLSVFAARRKLQWAGVALAAVGFCGASVSYWSAERTQRQTLRVTHLNVGAGDAAVVEFPGGKILLIDAGGAAVGDFDTGESIVAPFLRSRKILKVDYLLVSHARIDHYGGMRAIANEFAPSEFWSAGTAASTKRFEELSEALAQTKIKQVTADVSTPCRTIEGAKLCFLYPQSGAGEDKPVALRLEFGKASFVFASDIDKRDEAALLQAGAVLPATAVKIPRHGSATASSPEFVAALKPKLAVLSAGARSRAEAKRDEILERYHGAGAEVLATYEDGAVIIETDGQSVSYSGYKSGRTGKLAL